MSESEKTLRTIQTRANRKVWITAVLTLLFPFAGYIYTIRYKAAIIAFFAMFFLMSAEEAMDMEEDSASSLYGFFIIALTAENSLSVRKARELAQHKGLQIGSNHYAPLPDARVQILKFGKQQGEVTLADLVIETGLPPEKIRDMVMELERQDLVRSYNREHDGAIVYRVI